MTCSGCHYGECSGLARLVHRIKGATRPARREMIAKPLMAAFNLMGKIA